MQLHVPQFLPGRLRLELPTAGKSVAPESILAVPLRWEDGQLQNWVL